MGMGNVEATTYDTTVDTITGVGLEADGTLSPGGTYQVLADEILAATDWGETFQGHVYLLADYTNCSGLGWVTDFMTVNQAYTATVIDPIPALILNNSPALPHLAGGRSTSKRPPLMDAFGGLFASLRDCRSGGFGYFP